VFTHKYDTTSFTIDSVLRLCTESWLVGHSVGRLVGWVGWLFGWLVGR